MNADREIIQKRAQEILSFAEELEKFSGISPEEFKKNSERQYAVMHVLQLAIEACLSVGNHIIARNHLGIPNNYQETFTLLEKANILPSDFAEEMKKMARFRNRLVHLYWAIDSNQLYEIITTRLGDFKMFVRYLNKMLLAAN